MASVNMIPYIEALANQVQQRMNLYRDPDRPAGDYSDIAGIASTMDAKYGPNWVNTLKSGIPLEDFYSTLKGSGFNEEQWMKNTPGGWWDAGYRPGMDLPQYNQSQMGDVIEWVTPPAIMAAAAYGGNALFGDGGLSAAAGGSGVGGGPFMPPAVPETAAQLAEWGLTEVAPGVWTAGGTAAGAATGAAAGASGAQAGGSAGGGLTGSGTVNYAAGTAPAASAFGAPTVASGLGSGLGSLSPQILGMAGGALLGGLGGTGETQTMTTEEGLPDWLIPYVKPQLDKYASELNNYQVDPYGIMPAASQEFKNTLSGMYLDPSTNKYLEQYFNAGAERVKSNLSPSFGHMQAFGSHSGYNEALSRGLGDLSLGLYGGAYETERNRQTQAMGAAPSFLQQQSQAAFAPYGDYLSTVGSLGRKKETPYYQPGPLQGILGGAMAGYGLGNIFK